MTAPHRVIKLGGSLLECDGLVERFRAWRQAQPAMRDTMLVGGGAMADAVRDAFARHALSEEAAHWLCIRVMGITAEMVAALLPEAELVDRLDTASDGPGLRVLRPEELLREEERECIDPLPHSWDVTSDSIAARVAQRLAAEELVLLKSSLPAGQPDLHAWAASGYVDRYFPAAAARVARVRVVSLRDEVITEVLAK